MFFTKQAALPAFVKKWCHNCGECCPENQKISQAKGNEWYLNFRRSSLVMIISSKSSIIRLFKAEQIIFLEHTSVCKCDSGSDPPPPLSLYMDVISKDMSSQYLLV